MDGYSVSTKLVPQVVPRKVAIDVLLIGSTVLLGASAILFCAAQFLKLRKEK